MGTYKYNDKSQLTNNLAVNEFRCKCGRQHDTIINERLPVMLQKIVDILDADHIYISSGYRCSAHDKAVGGWGQGQHTYGNAADIAIEKGGKFIDPRVIAAVAQEVGFGGIGRIDLQYIHCDVRTSNIWRGDEYIGATSYSLFRDGENNYWNYYKLKRSDYIKEETPVDNDSLEVKLQKILNNKGSKLSVDGIIGNLTLTDLRNYTIEPNDSGELTRWTQTALKVIGYDVDINGTADKKTMDAIHQFQKDNKLGVGIMNGGDWGSLFKALTKGESQ